MTTELTAADSGRTVTVHVGDVVSVRLSESPTTGYRWQPDIDTTRLRAADDRYEPAQPQARGGGGERVLGFEVLRAGTTALRLAERRSWESGPASTEFSVQLDVQG
ncbi:MAG: protease inhibitor I42 family protein [Actinomycetes bacterium]